MNKITIRTLKELIDFIDNSNDVNKIEFVLQKALKTLCIFNKEVDVKEVKAAAIDLINEYWINKKDYEKPLFLIIPKEDN